MEFFEKIGARVARQWRAFNFDERYFPQVALEALEELPPHRHVSLWDVTKWGLTADILPYQEDLDAKFGDPPLTVYVGRGFRIEVLFWRYGVPAIHQHSFSGAFHVMRGASIHSLWTFDTVRRLEARLLIGNVEFRSAELLVQGDSRVILAGVEMYHSTFHLDCPSISVVVRTISEQDKLPQYTLLPPSLAYASQQRVPTLQRQAQLLEMLVRSGRRAEYQDLTAQLFATKDALTVCDLLASTYDSLEEEEERFTLLRIATTNQPVLMSALIPALRRQSARKRLLNIERTLSDDHLKYFVALLLNVPDRDAILELVRARYSSRVAVDAIIGSVRQISQLAPQGLKVQEHWLRMLKCMLECPSREEAIRNFCAGSSRIGTPLAESSARALASHLETSWLTEALAVTSRASPEADHEPASANGFCAEVNLQ